MAFHAQVPWSSGGFLGVDVFFVISGFLITRLLVVELETTGTIAWRAFEARRVRRLWPALALVIVTTLVMGVAMWSPLEWRGLMQDAAAGTGYVANLAFAHRNVGYFDQPLEESPYLHLWSLGVEEQFYVGWPLLLLGTAWLARRLRLDGWRTLAAAIAGLGVASLVLMLWLVHRHSPNVFFLTPARLWELAAGGLIGLRAVKSPIGSPDAGRLYLALGLVLLASTVVSPGLRPAEPMLQTLAPVAGTVLVLEGIRRGSRLPMPKAVASGLSWIGWYSYGWYLWHWPLVAAAKLWWRTDDLRYLIPASGLALAAAVVSRRWVEDPIRFRTRSPLGRLPTWGVIAGVVAVVATALAANTWLRIRALENPKVRALAAVHTEVDGPAVLARCPNSPFNDGCILGDAASPRVLVVAGDSHAAQWLPALDSAGRMLGIKVVPHVRGACPPWPIRFRHDSDAGEDTECAEFQRQLPSLLARYGAVSLVLASSTGEVDHMLGRLTPDQRARIWTRGTADLLRAVPKQVRIIIIEKSPQFGFDPVDCLVRAAFWHARPSCDAPYASATALPLQYSKLEAGAAAGSDRVRIFPTIYRLCSPRSCRAEIGHVVVFRNGGHLTPNYALGQTARWLPYLRWAASSDRPKDTGNGIELASGLAGRQPGDAQAVPWREAEDRHRR